MRMDEDAEKLAASDFAPYYWDDLVKNGRDRLSGASARTLQSMKTDMVSMFTKTLEELSSVLTKNQPVFCSKLLHWTFPEAFPIMDRNVLKTIGDEHQEIGMKPMPEHWSSDRVEAYKRVVDFYSYLEDQLGPSGKGALEEADFHSQPMDPIRVRYGWLRVVDKWLWLRGKETNE